MSNEEVLSVEESNVTDAERQEILEQINGIVAQNDFAEGAEVEEIRPGKKGIGLPIAINIIALVVVVGVFFGANWLGDRRQIDLNVASQEFASPEGRLIAEIRRESEARLGQKDAEILRIQSELSQLDEERERLKSEAEDEIARKESEFQQALQTQIALERTRLEALGRSDADISAQITELEQSVRAEQQAELTAYRTEAEAALAAKDSELERTREQTAQILDEARQERLSLEAESKAREAEIVERYEAEKLELEERTSAAEQELSRISEAQSREALIEDQIIATYSLIKRRLENNEFDQAGTDLEQLRLLLLSPEYDSIPVIAQRRETELFIIDSLESLVSMQASAEEQKAQESLIDSANLLYSARGLVSLGDELYETGELAASSTKYRDAVRLLPYIDRAVTRISSNDQMILDERISQILGVVAGDALTESDFDVADRYLSAASLGAGGTPAKQAVIALDATLRSMLNESETDAAQIQSDLEAEVTRLSSALLEANARITRSTNDNQSLRESIRLAESDVSDLQDRVTALMSENSRLDEDLSAERSSVETLEDEKLALSAKLREVEGSYERTASNLEEVDDRLGSAEDELATTRAELASTAEELEILRSEYAAVVDDARVAEQDSETAAETAAATIASLEELLADAGLREDELEAEIAELRSDADAAESDLETANENLSVLRDDLAQATTSYNNLVDSSVVKSDLQSVFAQYANPLEQSLSSDDVDFAEANDRFTALLAALDERWFPGLRSIGKRTVAGILIDEVQRAGESSRRSALNEILRYLDYTQSDGGSLASRLAFEALSSKDLLYRRVFAEIDAVLGRSVDEVLVEAGEVTDFDGREIDVTVPGDGAKIPESGATVLVKRADADGTLHTIAQGVVTSVSGSAFRADIRLFLDENLPVSGDIVFIEP